MPVLTFSLEDASCIHAIRHIMVDQEVTIRFPEIRENKLNAGRRVAIVGAGPAGLTCAYFLARLGYRPVVFEAEQRPGGMLMQTIPGYRLPKESVATEIRMIQQMGVDIRTNQKIGKDFSLRSLREDGFECVFIGIGIPGGVKLDIPGSKGPGVIDGFQFLRHFNQRGSIMTGEKVVVVGGGNCATDVARSAIRLGADVDIIYRRAKDQMSAYAEELEASLKEGVRIHTHTIPVEIMRQADRIVSVKCQTTSPAEANPLGAGAAAESVRTFIIPADQVIFAIGQEFDFSSICDEEDMGLIGNERIQANQENGQTTVPWIFTGGDAATGPTSVIEAIAGGERAAVGIDQYLTGSNHAFWRKDPDVDSFPDEAGDLPFRNDIDLPWIETIAIQQGKPT